MASESPWVSYLLILRVTTKCHPPYTPFPIESLSECLLLTVRLHHHHWQQPCLTLKVARAHLVKSYEPAMHEMVCILLSSHLLYQQPLHKKSTSETGMKWIMACALTITYCAVSVIFLATERKKRATKVKSGHGLTCPLPAACTMHAAATGDGSRSS
jgi:hypothetical protein